MIDDQDFRRRYQQLKQGLETLGEAKAIALARHGSGQIYAYVANGGGGLTIFRLRYRLSLPLLLRNSP